MHGQIFPSGKWSQIWGSPLCEKHSSLVMLQVPFASSSTSSNGVTPFWALQEEGSMVGFTRNLLGSIPAMGWESWRPGSREAHGQEPKRGVMPFPRFTAVNTFLYETG